MIHPYRFWIADLGQGFIEYPGTSIQYLLAVAPKSVTKTLAQTWLAMAEFNTSVSLVLRV